MTRIEQLLSEYVKAHVANLHERSTNMGDTEERWERLKRRETAERAAKEAITAYVDRLERIEAAHDSLYKGIRLTESATTSKGE